MGRWWWRERRWGCGGWGWWPTATSSWLTTAYVKLIRNIRISANIKMIWNINISAISTYLQSLENISISWKHQRIKKTSAYRWSPVKLGCCERLGPGVCPPPWQQPVTFYISNISKLTLGIWNFPPAPDKKKPHGWARPAHGVRGRGWSMPRPANAQGLKSQTI